MKKKAGAGFLFCLFLAHIVSLQPSGWSAVLCDSRAFIFIYLVLSESALYTSAVRQGGAGRRRGLSIALTRSVRTHPSLLWLHPCFPTRPVSLPSTFPLPWRNADFLHTFWVQRSWHRLPFLGTEPAATHHLHLAVVSCSSLTNTTCTFIDACQVLWLSSTMWIC